VCLARVYLMVKTKITIIKTCRHMSCGVNEKPQQTTSNLPILLVMAAAHSLHLFLVARSIGFCPLESRPSTSAPWSSSSSVKRSLLSTVAACNALYSIVIIIIINISFIMAVTTGDINCQTVRWQLQYHV